jgi:hypothetical protein
MLTARQTRLASATDLPLHVGGPVTRQSVVGPGERPMEKLCEFSHKQRWRGVMRLYKVSRWL